MTWSWPQFVLAGLLVLSLGFTLAKDGQLRTDKHSFGRSVVFTALWVWLLYMGGFWTTTP
jgi:hypothetical protein